MSIEGVKTVPIIDIAKRLGIEVVGNKAHCFAHEDSTPSLSFNEQGNYFKCFGCNVGGSTIDLVKLAKNVGTSEAIRWIEQEYGLENSHSATSGKNGQVCGILGKTQQRAFLADSGASGKRDGREFSDLYRELLETGDERAAIEYMDTRGIWPEVTRWAGIKVVGRDQAEALLQRHDTDTLLGSGLFKDGKDGRPYYTLGRHRLVIPYLDRDGQTVLMLQGRDIDGASDHKYQMLPGIETVLYNLQALDGAKTVHVCEGALDVLSALQLGMDSPLGIAGVSNFKDEYFSLLDPCKVVIAADADGAGKDFYLKIKAHFLKLGKRIMALDWERLKADYGLPAGVLVKDLNDIAKLADYGHKTAIGPKRIRSPLLGETCTVFPDGALFDSGVRYDREELELIADFSEVMVTAVHQVKTVFNGRIIA